MHIPRFGSILLLLGILVLLVASGCGDGADREAYEQGLARMQQQLDEANDASRRSADTVDSEQRKAALGEAHEALAAAAKTASSLDPPEDAADAHERLVSALTDYADLFRRIAELDEGDPNESELYSEAGEIVDRLAAANRALDKAGYDATSEAKS